MRTEIMEPYPRLLILNFNWRQPELSSAEILKLFMSFRDALSLKDFYYTGPKKNAAD